MIRRTLGEALVVCGVALAPAAAPWAWRPAAAPPGAQTPRLRPDEVSVRRAVALGEGVLWVDARPEGRFAAERVPGALPLTLGGWDNQLFDVLDAVVPGEPVVVYCESVSCGTSREVADRLRGVLGDAAEVYALHGGWDAWREAQR